MEQRCLAGSRRSDNQAALSHAKGRHQIHDARRIAIWHCFKLDALVWVDGGELFERHQALIFCWLFAIDFEQLGQLWTSVPPPGLAINPHAVAQSKATDYIGRHENILRCLNEVSLRVPQESKTFARNFNDAFAEFRLALNLLAIFNGAFGSFRRLSI